MSCPGLFVLPPEAHPTFRQYKPFAPERTDSLSTSLRDLCETADGESCSRRPDAETAVFLFICLWSQSFLLPRKRIDLMRTDGNQTTNSPKKKKHSNLAAPLVEEQSETSISLCKNHATFTGTLQPHRQTSLTELDRFPSQQSRLQTVRSPPSRGQPASRHHPQSSNAGE